MGGRFRASGSGGANAAIRQVRRVSRGGGHSPARARHAERPSPGPSRQAATGCTHLGSACIRCACRPYRAGHCPLRHPRAPFRHPGPRSGVHPWLAMPRGTRRTETMAALCAAAAAGGEQGEPARLPRDPRLGPGSGAGATVGNMQCEAGKRRYVNPVARKREGRQGAAAEHEPCFMHVGITPSPTGSGSPIPARILRGRPCARRRAFRGGAVRAPDCARETEGRPLPSASRRFSESGAARPRSTGEAAPDASSFRAF